MCRSWLLTAALAVAALVELAAPPATATAQTLLPPNPICLIRGCHEDRNDEGSHHTACPSPATIVCAAGGAVVGGIADAVGGVAQAGLSAAGNSIMGGLTSWVAGGAAWLLDKAARLLERSSRPALGSTWFKQQYRTMVGLAVALALLFLLCAVLQGVLRQDLAMLARSALLALPLAMLLCFASVTLVETALGVTDWMTASVLGSFHDDTAAFLGDVGHVLGPASLTGSPLPGFILFLGALFTTLATFVVWLELVMREAAIYLTVAFLPLCFAAMVWERTAHWCRRLVELLAAIVLAKFTIAMAIALAASAMGHARPGADGGLTALMAGCAVMVIAAFTPWLLLRLIPMAEAAGHVALHRGSARSAVGAAPGAQTGAMVARQTVLAAVAPGGGGAAGRQQLLGIGAPAPKPPGPPMPRPPAQPTSAPRAKAGDK
jgi:hypothetical protein